jgi:2-polyprenyl-3-methyl-5-hydroxy-6-metoxy-1,4-benzoquinol methylase
MGAGSISERQARAHAYENPRPEVAALVAPGARRVLDLGCASGALGAALKARQACEVVGIEVDPQYARHAEARLDRVICGDVATAEVDGTFDCLIAADVLEHLVDPWAALARYAALLEPGGRAVISLPNARHWEVLLEIGVRGTFPRRPAGIFDRTHLRWFTLADAYGLCSGAGLEVEEVRRVPRPGAPGWTATVPGLRAFGAFQHLVAARRLPSTATSRRG